MLKWLVLAAAVFAAVWMLRRALSRRDPAPPPAAGPAQAALVGCAHCGVNLPRGEALERDGHLYCSDEHLRLGPAR